MRRCQLLYNSDGSRIVNTTPFSDDVGSKESKRSGGSAGHNSARHSSRSSSGRTGGPSSTGNNKRRNSSGSSRATRASAFFDWPDEKEMADTPEYAESTRAYVEHDVSESAPAFPQDGSDDGSDGDSNDDDGWNYRSRSMLDDEDTFPRTAAMMNGRENGGRLPQTLLSLTSRNPAERKRPKRTRETLKPIRTLYGIARRRTPQGMCAECGSLGNPQETVLLCDGDK